MKARSSRSNQAREAGRWPGDVHDESVNMMEIELGKGGFREVFRKEKHSGLIAMEMCSLDARSC